MENERNILDENGFFQGDIVGGGFGGSDLCGIERLDFVNLQRGADDLPVEDFAGFF